MFAQKCLFVLFKNGEEECKTGPVWEDWCQWEGEGVRKGEGG